MLTLILSRFKLRNRIFLGYVFPIIFDLVIVFLVWFGFSYFQNQNSLIFNLSEQQKHISNMANKTVTLQETVQTYLRNGSNYLIHDVTNMAEKLDTDIQASQLDNKDTLSENLTDYLKTFNLVTQAREDLEDLIDHRLPSSSLNFQQGLANSLDRDIAQSLIYRSIRIEKLTLKYFINKDYQLVEEALELLKSMREVIQQEAGVRPLETNALILKLDDFENNVLSAMTKTRTFLSLVSTVMAGHASEILYTMDYNNKQMTTRHEQEQRHLKAFLDQFLWMIMLGLVAILLVSITVSFFVAGTITRPIQELTRYYAQITNRQMDDTIPQQPHYKAHDEISDLYQVLNELMSYQRQTIMMQRNESIGHMTRQMSHEFKNLMTPIIGFSKMLKLQIKDETAINTLEHITDVAEKAVDLIRDMQIYTGEFGSFDETENVSCEIHHELDKNTKLIRATVPSQIQLTIQNKLDDGKQYVRLSRTAVTQILMNIVQNAIHALETTKQPSITLTSQTVGVGEIHITVCNNGAPIPSSVLDKMFDPFYTTKEAGKGTGMGLSVVIGFIEKAGGKITVTSDNEQTCFAIILPTSSVTAT